MIVDPLAEDRPAIYQRNLCIAEIAIALRAYSIRCRAQKSAYAVSQKVLQRVNVKVVGKEVGLELWCLQLGVCCSKEEIRMITEIFEYISCGEDIEIHHHF